MKIYLIGFMGSGKSHWGKELSNAMELPFIDLDAEIVQKEGLSIPEIFEQKGEAAFRKLENQYLRKLSDQENLLLSCGGGTPCFSDNMGFMNAVGLTVWLDAPVGVMVSRLQKRKQTRPLLKSLNDNELYVFVEKKLEERNPFYKQAQLIVDPTKYTVTTLTQKIKSCTSLI